VAILTPTSEESKVDGHTEELVVLVSTEPPVDNEELAQLTARLQSELLALDVEQVEKARARDLPVDAKAGVAEVLGVLLVKAGPAVVGPVVRTIKSWLARGRNRSAELVWKGNRLNVTGVSSEEQNRLIEAWIRLVEEG
jgi:hypothetical protein